MKFLVVGLGSMGKRRIRNLQYLKAGEIIGFDVREDRRREAEEKYAIKTFDEFDKALQDQPDALVISTPPALHVKYAMEAAKNNKHFFMEANVLTEGMDELIALCDEKRIVAAPSCTMRFHPGVKLMKKIVDNNTIGKNLAFSHHCGQYLPDWHPWEDYRKFYAARRMTGACREMVPFELTWITWILGKVTKISGMKDKLSNLEVDIDDVYQLLLEFENGSLGNMLVDVVSRFPFRTCKLIGETGAIIWDANEKYVKVFTVDSGKWKKYEYEAGVPERGYIYGEKTYIDEMAHFIGAIKGEEKYMHSLAEDKEVLELLYAAEKSSEKGEHVRIT